MELKRLGRWNGVSGHIGAVIATLLDLGWDPVSPSTWKDNHGNLWALDGNSSSLKRDLQSIVGTTIQEQLWSKACQAYLGKGGEQGIDWHLTLPTLRFLKGKKGNPKAAGALEAAMPGGSAAAYSSSASTRPTSGASGATKTKASRFQMTPSMGSGHVPDGDKRV